METATEDTQKESAENAASSNTATNIQNATAPLPVEQKKNKKEDRTKKDDKNVEQFMKSLNSIPTLEEKLSLVCKKYVQTVDDNKKMQFYIKQSDKRFALLSKEKEQLQLEFNKTILVKSKLENLCRELQKQNKAIKEESLLKIREEEERRKETQAKFQNTLSEITTMLQQNNEKNAKLRDDNISMTEKFKSVVTQYQLREQQVDKMTKQMALENQLSEAKMQKASLEHQADKERLLAEMEQLKVTVATYRAKVMELQGTETNLRSQLAVYTDKYDEFQNALVKSNQMFGGFKEQMDKMSKKIKKLEKESLSWKTRWETSQTALLDMCGERQASEERAANVGRQLLHMQSLCRTLQAERTILVNALKENNIERPPLPPPAPAPPAPSAPAPTPASNAKVDAMAANCAQLRQSLAHLQTQLNVLTNKQKEESPKPEPKPEKQEKKKSKSKKNKGEKKAENNVPKEESDEKDLTDENQPSASDDTAQKEEKVDDETLENLIQAINNANINLCDLEVVSDEIAETVKSSVEIEEITETQVNEKPEDSNKSLANTASVESNTENSNDGSSNVLAERSNVVENLNESLSDLPLVGSKVVENTNESPSNVPLVGSKVVEVSNETSSKVPKVESNVVENSNESPSNIVPVESKSVDNGDKIELTVEVKEVKEEKITPSETAEVKLVDKDSKQNVSIVESSNDEISHINEVKPITNNA